MSNKDTQVPLAPSTETSMLSGHTQYVKGYAESTIGNVVGSVDWKKSGDKDMEGGVSEMKEANKNKTSKLDDSGIGEKIEQMAGSAAGCEGMEKEGTERQTKVS
ncbi:hypothetical protein BJ875DRAFT_507979 [Amylocarpus encephaloides]|uniref:CsbD-like domain-containing protein n=1 Tax=Amylocarpus encephaloides TaxID=45428 RepID=A0A9P8C114_9HELO|nr:hypothetical protein BJ875DRAFT_507979 [Amylocarpus encephaloides]